MGSCEIYPQKLEHSPNGRYVVACGDGEWIIYTSTALRNKCSSTIIFYVFKFFLYFQHLVLVKTSHGRLTPTPTPFKRVVRSSNSLRILRFSSHCHTLIMQNSPNQPKPSKNWVLIFKLHFRRVFFLSMRFFCRSKSRITFANFIGSAFIKTGHRSRRISKWTVVGSSRNQRPLFLWYVFIVHIHLWNPLIVI